ncbi:MAG: DUF2513 domain-containing protein [Gemmatimonadaceae bacterium]
MKRDLDLVRQLLLQIEALPAGPPAQYPTREIEDPVLLAHFELVIAAGLVNGNIARSQGARGDVISISGLTWEGHEWIEMVRSQTVWNETKAALLESAGAMTYELTKDVASKLLRARLAVSEGRLDSTPETAIVKRERAGWDSNPRDP